jgi:DNA-binding GntR family transcriptional regulator
MSAKPSRDEALHSFLYRALLEKIINGEFAPGQRLIEEELARAYGVSRTPIREVLLSLVKDGCVERARNCGARVVAFTAEDVEELFDLRSALEIHCISTVVRSVKVSELLELQQLLEAVESESGSRLLEEHASIDLKLHHLIVENSGNRRLIAQMRHLSLLIESLQLTSFSNDEQARKTGEQHLAIVGALIRRDVELAKRLLTEHIEYGKRNVLQMFIKSTYQQELVAKE